MFRKLILIILPYLLSISCNQNIYRSNLQVSNFSDSTINKIIILKDSYSVIKSLGNIDSLVNESDTASPDIYFYNISKTEYLRMKKWYGDGANVFKIFEVGKSKSLPKSIPILNSDFINFNTESGVKIGMKKSDFLQIKSKFTYVEKESKDLTILNYSDGELYNATYYFKNNLLIKFEFGYSYP